MYNTLYSDKNEEHEKISDFMSDGGHRGHRGW